MRLYEYVRSTARKGTVLVYCVDVDKDEMVSTGLWFKERKGGCGDLVADLNRRLTESIRKKEVGEWTKVGCCEACWNATEKACVCSCGGLRHGGGVTQKLSGDESKKW